MSPERTVFIVRVWPEHDQRLAAPVLRGSLQRLGAGEAQYFDSLAMLLALVQTALASDPRSDLNAKLSSGVSDD